MKTDKELEDKVKERKLKNGKTVKSFYRRWETSFSMTVTDMFPYKYELDGKEIGDLELTAYLNKQN